MEKQFVTYGIALKLKEIGFSEPCLAWYLPEIAEKENICTPILASYVRDWNKMFKDRLNCPLWQQVIDWLREKYDIDIVITPDSSSGYRIPARKYFITIWKYYNGLNVQPEVIRKDNNILYFVKPQNAREQAILKAIEIITQK